MRGFWSVLVVLLAFASTACTSSAAIMYSPTIRSPQTAGEIVGFRLQNTTSSTQSARYVTFGQVFKAGAVSTSTQLVARFGSSSVPVQMDVKTTHTDGSVRFGVLTLQAPQLAINTVVEGMLAVGGSPQPPLSLPVALAGQNITVTLSGGVSASLDVTQALTNAIAAGQASYWLQGPLAAQARVDIPVVGALHVIADVTAYTDGQIVTDLTFANDYAMGSVGGTRSYTATIRRNGQVVYTSPALTHYQYQQWRWTDRSNAVNVQRDLPYLIAHRRAAELRHDDRHRDRPRSAAATYAPLGAAGIDKVHARHGRPRRHRPDHQRQRQVAAQPGSRAAAACAGAGECGGQHSMALLQTRPSGDYLSLDDYPTLWADPRGNPTLTQPVNEPTWAIETRRTSPTCRSCPTC